MPHIILPFGNFIIATGIQFYHNLATAYIINAFNLKEFGTLAPP